MAGHVRTALAHHRRHRFAWLFVALLATLGARPLLAAFGSEHDALSALMAATLVVAAAGLAREPGMRWLAGLALASVAVLGLQAMLRADWRTAQALLWVVGFGLAGVASVRRSLTAGPVDGERVFAALDGYLLAALLFAAAYWALERAQPGSFAGALGAGGIQMPEAVYLSFVTIASLGYGDLVPRSEAARSLAVVEAVGGQMYLAVLVARLVSLYAREDRTPP